MRLSSLLLSDGWPLAQKENVDEDILVMGKGTNKVEIDLMQPIDPERAPKVHVPTLNHIGLWVDDLHKCVDELTAKDVRFTPGGIRKGAGDQPLSLSYWLGSAQHAFARPISIFSLV